MGYLEGIDISYAQEATPKLEGLTFAFAKASEGLLTDRMWHTHSRNIRASGIVFGAYHFAFDGVGVTAQADAFLALAKDAEILALDVEGDHRFTPEQARRWIAYVKARSGGRPVGLYMSDYPFYGAIGQDFSWVANYVARPRRPFAFWQYGYSHVVKLGGRGVDGDYFNGTLADLYRLARRGLPDTATEEANPMLPISGTTPTLVDIAKGTQLYDLNGQPKVKASGFTVQSLGQSGEFDLIPVKTGAEPRQLLLVKTVACRNRRVLGSTPTIPAEKPPIDPPPVTPPPVTPPPVPVLIEHLVASPAAFGITDQGIIQLASGGVGMTYRPIGYKDGPVAVLIHGGPVPEGSGNVGLLPQALATAGFATYSIDYDPAYPTSLAEVCADIDQVKALAGKDPLIVGHSLGGYLGSVAALQGRGCGFLGIAPVLALSYAQYITGGYAGAPDPVSLFRPGLPMTVVTVDGDDRVPLTAQEPFIAAHGARHIALAGTDHSSATGTQQVVDAALALVKGD